jgi:MFS family permease
MVSPGDRSPGGRNNDVNNSPARSGDPRAADASAGFHIGPLGFAPGVRPVNAWTYLYVSFVIMTVVSFLNFSLPYVLDELVGVPPEQKGRVTGFLVTMQEIIQLCLISYIGSLSDRFGRRALYAAGVAIIGIGYFLYSISTSVTELYAYRVVFAVGLAMAGTMIAVTAADYPAERSRGRMAGVTGVLNGLGVGLATVLFAALPTFFASQGIGGEKAGRYMLMTIAALCVFTGIIMQIGMMGGTPTGRRVKAGVLTAVRIGISEGLKNRRLLVCYAGSLASRADLTLVATFVSLWLQQAGRNEGLTSAEAIGQAGILFGVIQLASLLFAPVAGMLLDRFNRLACLGCALLIAATGYTFFGLQAHPFGPAGYVGAALTGFGQMGVILSVTALLGQEAPVAVRGSVIGLAGFCGAMGILATSLAGGFLFDHVSISAPVMFVGFVNFLIFCGALLQWLADGRPVYYDRNAVVPGDAAQVLPH